MDGKSILLALGLCLLQILSTQDRASAQTIRGQVTDAASAQNFQFFHCTETVRFLISVPAGITRKRS